MTYTIPMERRSLKVEPGPRYGTSRRITVTRYGRGHYMQETRTYDPTPASSGRITRLLRNNPEEYDSFANIGAAYFDRPARSGARPITC